ncbi:hypothetical protein TNCV_4961131 [Trichonephila clavipes]|uniref:Uncharacterized protein n=1 Tax=Trichonephila clavipes TaxID=2585209 RepID=A0A8X6SVL3_TRICX|nr:hypothetical protein TNCV_4961131 [Trichonephila clavipes]
MNSPDYDNIIDMFSVPTPVSPLPPTPVASPSHEPSQDVIYDSERRNVERRNEERWNEERRPRDPRLYRRPDFRPPYQRPKVFRRPPHAQQLMPTSQENAQVFFLSQGLSVLCIRNSGFTLTNGVVSYVIDRKCLHELFKFLHYLNVGTICVTDQHSKQTFKGIQANWSSSSPFKRTPVMILNSNGRDLGQCLFCNQTTCHRWIAVKGMCAILHQHINPIFHSCLATDDSTHILF